MSRSNQSQPTLSILFDSNHVARRFLDRNKLVLAEVSLIAKISPFDFEIANFLTNLTLRSTTNQLMVVVSVGSEDRKRSMHMLRLLDLFLIHAPGRLIDHRRRGWWRSMAVCSRPARMVAGHALRWRRVMRVVRMATDGRWRRRNLNNIGLLLHCVLGGF
jgi:hypothetical protein